VGKVWYSCVDGRREPGAVPLRLVEGRRYEPRYGIGAPAWKEPESLGRMRGRDVGAAAALAMLGRTMTARVWFWRGI
jgi:hypothetical protein